MMTTRGSIFSGLILAVLALPALAADPALMQLVPPDAAVVGGMNLEQAKASPLGQFLLKQVPFEDEGMRKMMEATGFDPRRDLREVVVATRAPMGPKHDNGLVVASGSFDPGRLTAMAKTLGVAPSNYAGVEVFTSQGPHAGWFAFLSPSLAVAGTADLVQAAIDRYKQGGGGLNPAMAAKAAEWSAKSDAWLVTAGSPADWARRAAPASRTGGPMQSVPLEAIEQSAAGLKFGATITITVEAVARTDKDAQALADVLKFVAGMVQLNRNKVESAEVAALLDSMQLKAEARTVSLGFSVPESQLEKMIETSRAKKGCAT
ncbi:MAG: hypothetical protein HY822_07470 [Acidobacteria bacterium]|nr:hypothetical protein [Acidobacteriota bacterium]